MSARTHQPLLAYVLQLLVVSAQLCVGAVPLPLPPLLLLSLLLPSPLPSPLRLLLPAQNSQR
jgi:hypothetical protein